MAAAAEGQGRCDGEEEPGQGGEEPLHGRLLSFGCADASSCARSNLRAAFPDAVDTTDKVWIGRAYVAVADEGVPAAAVKFLDGSGGEVG
ncbi:MAG: hypothetical protein Kow0092_24910 [Deferrisomatales bacterium]